MTRRKVIGTANYVRNLQALRDFRTDHPEAFERAVARLQDEVLPLLRQQANVGRLYGRNSPPPIVEKVRQRLGGGMLREVLVGEYVVLYLVRSKDVVMLSMRHQRELDFDFGD